MACEFLKRGFDSLCVSPMGKYVQQALLMNFEDLSQVNYGTFPAVMFYLKASKTAYAFKSNPLSDQVVGSYTMSRENNLPRYEHSVSFPIVGLSDTAKKALREIDLGRFFAALKFSDGTIEIYGIGNGLINEGYTYNAQDTIAGSVITLKSKYNEIEEPLTYSGASSDFDNLFVNSAPIPTFGDYNTDYNLDFAI